MRAAKAYRRNQTETASREEVLLMLYDGAIRFVDDALDGVRADDAAHAGARISRVLAIVAELQGALDFRHSPSLCQALDSLYTFMTQRLLEANKSREPQALHEVRGLLVSLRDTWREAADIVREEQATQRAEYRAETASLAYTRA